MKLEANFVRSNKLVLQNMIENASLNVHANILYKYLKRVVKKVGKKKYTEQVLCVDSCVYIHFLWKLKRK